MNRTPDSQTQIRQLAWQLLKEMRVRKSKTHEFSIWKLEGSAREIAFMFERRYRGQSQLFLNAQSSYWTNRLISDLSHLLINLRTQQGWEFLDDIHLNERLSLDVIKKLFAINTDFKITYYYGGYGEVSCTKTYEINHKSYDNTYTLNIALPKAQTLKSLIGLYRIQKDSITKWMNGLVYDFATANKIRLDIAKTHLSINTFSHRGLLKELTKDELYNIVQSL